MIQPFSIELYNKHKDNCIVINRLGEEQVIISTDSLLIPGRPVKARPKSQDPDIDAFNLYKSNGQFYKHPTYRDLYIEIEDRIVNQMRRDNDEQP